tara:strand:- start:5 stop:544 length:540 start_codon:yes stop_codon:yes gene_type:complete
MLVAVPPSILTPPPPCATAIVTYSVLAICVVFILGAAVGAVGMPVKAAFSKGGVVFLTKAVVAIVLSLLEFAGVGIVAVPVNTGFANGAFKDNPVFIVFKRVVAKLASLLIANASSFKVSKAAGEFAIKLSIAVLTKAVLAICVVFMVGAAVGAVGIPVKAASTIAFGGVNVNTPVVLL